VGGEVDISIIIVSWNVAELLRKCLASVYRCTGSCNIEIIVVDNASFDNSVNMVKRDFNDVVLLENTSNRGFAAACNQGIRMSVGKYILLLNPDTEVKFGIENVIKFAEHDNAIGVVACQLVNDANQRMLSYQSFPTFLRIFTFFTGLNEIFKHPLINKILQPVYCMFPLQAKHRQVINKIEEVDSACGAFLLCKKELFSKIGMFDENYFMYFEETDFCKRVKNNGYKNYFFPHYSIIHLEGESARKTKSSLKYYADSLLYYFKKNHHYVGFLSARAILYCAILVRIFVSLAPSIFSKNSRRDLLLYLKLSVSI
jgi:hypothetical protein